MRLRQWNLLRLQNKDASFFPKIVETISFFSKIAQLILALEQLGYFECLLLTRVKTVFVAHFSLA